MELSYSDNLDVSWLCEPTAKPGTYRSRSKPTHKGKAAVRACLSTTQGRQLYGDREYYVTVNSLIDNRAAYNKCIAKMQADGSCVSTVVFQFSFISSLTLVI